MGMLGDVSGAMGYSTNSNGSINSAQNRATNQSQSWSQTYAAMANQASAQAAEQAYQRALQIQKNEMDFNREEARKQREWQAEMANTVYTRSVDNMKAAGINPILAANLGLSAASVGSGATASVSGMSAPMAQTFMDTSSASSASGESYGESNGSSWGKGYSENESGLAVGLQMMGDAIAQAISSKNTASTVNYIMDKATDFGDSFKSWAVENLPNSVLNMLGFKKEKEPQGVQRKKTTTGHAKVEGRGNGGHSGGGSKF